MGRLFHTFVCFLLAAQGLVPASAQHADGVSPNGSGYADDVVSVDLAWDDDYPEFEGSSFANVTGGDSGGSDPTPDLRRRHMHVSNLHGGASERGYDYNPHGDSHLNASHGPGTAIHARAAQNFYIRLMPLGASITEGVRSSDGNGYRKWLRDQLRWRGWKVNMVGSKQNGNMADKDNEGHPRWVISQVHTAFLQSAWMRPNLVVINVGTNDCLGGIDIPNAGTRLKSLVDDVFAYVPGVTVIVTTLARSRVNDACAATVSQQYRNLVASYPSSTRIALADLYAGMLMTELDSDGVHPNNGGYKVFAGIIWRAFHQVEAGIQPPAAAPGIDDAAVAGPSTCRKIAGKARGPIQTQMGSGHDDGKYVHNRVDRGILASARIQKNNDNADTVKATPKHIFFANVVVSNLNFDRKTALDDWIRIYRNSSSGKNEYYFRQNQGGGVFGSSVRFYVNMTCDVGPNYAFADFNNDGLDDFFCIRPGGSVWVSLNRGGNPPQFESIGEVVPVKLEGLAADVRIADIDGDGRADFCMTRPDSSVVCSRNGGRGDHYVWQGFTTAAGLRGQVFGLKPGVNNTGIRFGDLNGDFRSDYLYVGDKGEVETWINARFYGPGIRPDWRKVGTTHPGFATPGIRNNIKFGRIYGSGRLDYVYVEEKTTYFDVRVWENTGSGGTRRKADGNFYCDMRGTGADDYVWIWSDGHAAELYANIHSPPEWGHGASISLSVPGPRAGIHLADWTGDGRCDVLVQNKATGALTLYANAWNAATQQLTFQNLGVVTGAATCTQGWGVGLFDRGMRLADIDGDGRADVLCIEPDGRTTAWLNRASGMVNVGQVKKSEGWDRANLRFADVEKSGRADLIWLNKYTGAATVMKNNGRMNGGSGSSFFWTARGVLYAPVGGRGENMHFANLNGLGRADLMWVIPTINIAYTYFNECPGTSGGDDGLILLPPGLPGGDGDEPPVENPPPDPIILVEEPNCEAEYSGLDDIIAHLNDIPDYCGPVYVIGALSDLLDSTVAKFDELQEDYDTKFGYYADYVRDLIDPQLERWMDNFNFDAEKKIGGGNRFFNCKYKDYESDTTWKYQGPCPVPKSIMQQGAADPEFGLDDWVIEYTIRDQAGFDAAVAAELGILPNWVKWDDYDHFPGCFEVCGGVHQWCKGNFPRMADQVTVPNPKDVVTEALGHISKLRAQFLAATLGVGLAQWDNAGDHSRTDAALALAMPVQLLAQAVDNMAEIKDIGSQLEDEQRNFIMQILGLVFLIIPFVGEVGLTMAGYLTLARFAMIGGEIANGALTIAEIVKDPNSAPVAILGMLTGLAGRGRRTEDLMGDAAKARLAMRPMDILAMGKTYKAIDDKVQTCISRCTR